MSDTLRERLAAYREDRRLAVTRIYLIAGSLVLLLLFEGLLEEIGVVSAPAEASFPDWLYTILVMVTFAVAFLLFLGWPIAIGIVVVFWGDWLALTPAALFLAAEIALAIYLFTGQDIDALFIVGGVLLAFFAVAAVGLFFLQRRASV